jgi:hypothetical protein
MIMSILGIIFGCWLVERNNKLSSKTKQHQENE